MASLSQTKIKVDRLRLIAVLKGRQQTDRKEFEKKVARREAALLKAKTEIFNDLKKAVSGGLESFQPSKGDRYSGYPLEDEVKSKTKIPGKPRDIDCDVKAMIATLELSTEETVPLSADQYVIYFPCKVEDED